MKIMVSGMQSACFWLKQSTKELIYFWVPYTTYYSVITLRYKVQYTNSLSVEFKRYMYKTANQQLMS